MAKRYRQGIFTPKHPEKFIGSKAVFRSGLELKFFRFCDNNENVIKWGSENIIVPYTHPLDGKTRRYFVDNYVVLKTGNGIKKYCVEIKPYKQTQKPTTKYRKKSHILYEAKQYAVNQSKWRAAEEYCKKHGYQFIIITEKELLNF